MTKTAKNILVAQTLNDMTTDALRAIAKEIGVPVGKSKKDTVANVAIAFNDGKAHFTAQVIIRTAPDASANRKIVYAFKYRTHKEDKQLFPILSPAKS
jgi:hypothetical protein